MSPNLSRIKIQLISTPQTFPRFIRIDRPSQLNHQSNEVFVHTIIEGLETKSMISLDSAVGQQALEKIYAEFYTLLNQISQGNPEWYGSGLKPVVQKIAGVLEIDGMTAQISAMQNMTYTFQQHGLRTTYILS